MVKSLEKKYVVTLGTSCCGGSHVRLRRPMPGDLWAELVFVMGDWGKHLRGERTKRFGKGKKA